MLGVISFFLHLLRPICALAHGLSWGMFPVRWRRCRVWCSGTKGSVAVDLAICFNVSVKADNSLLTSSLIHIQEWGHSMCHEYYPVYICWRWCLLVRLPAPCEIRTWDRILGAMMWGQEGAREARWAPEWGSRTVVSQGRRESCLKARAVPLLLFNWGWGCLKVIHIFNFY